MMDYEQEEKSSVPKISASKLRQHIIDNPRLAAYDSRENGYEERLLEGRLIYNFKAGSYFDFGITETGLTYRYTRWPYQKYIKASGYYEQSNFREMTTDEHFEEFAELYKREQEEYL